MSNAAIPVEHYFWVTGGGTVCTASVLDRERDIPSFEGVAYAPEQGQYVAVALKNGQRSFRVLRASYFRQALVEAASAEMQPSLDW